MKTLTKIAVGQVSYKEVRNFERAVEVINYKNEQ